MASDDISAGGADDAQLAASLAAWWREAGVDVPAREAPARPAGGSARRAASDPPPPARSDRGGADASRADAPSASAPTTSASSHRPARRAFTDTITSRKAAAGSRPGDRPTSGPGRGDETPDDATSVAEAARATAAGATTLDALRAALEGFADHPLHASARTTVFARGTAGAPVMIVGEAPGREEDRQGLPFVGRSGKLLDAMFAAIGLSAAPHDAQQGLYITNIVNWRPPGNRNPSTDEIALCHPFVAQHIALARPQLLVLAGGVAAQTMLETRQGIMRLRGRWATYTPPGGAPIPVLPMHHPAFVLRRPIAKRDAWTDLLALEARLADMG